MLKPKINAIQRLSLLCLAAGFLSGCDQAVKPQPQAVGDEIIVQRASEAVIWALPAIGVYDIEQSIQSDLGGKFGDIVYFSKPMESRHGFLTANDVTPYVISAQSTADGPLVVEVPPASEKVSFFGTFVDAWQTPIADVGPPGEDQGKGAKYLFLPPNYDGDVPAGYLAFRPATYSVHFAFRPVASNGGTYQDQSNYVQKLKVYPLKEAGNPPPNTFIDAYDKTWNTLPVYDISYFNDLNAIVQREPVLERDKVMMAMLADLGIRKGQPFNPDEKTKQVLSKGLKRAYDYLQDSFIRVDSDLLPYWQDRQWATLNLSKEQVMAGFPFEESERLLYDERGKFYFLLTYLPKQLGGGSYYLFALKDRNGNLLNGKDTYRLTVPKDTPAKDFWSVIVYSMASKGFIENVDRVGLSSQKLDQMKRNDDGSVDLFFGPQAPKGHESNWIPTGEDFFLIFRLYGPEKSLFDKSWKLGDVVKVE